MSTKYFWQKQLFANKSPAKQDSPPGAGRFGGALPSDAKNTRIHCRYAHPFPSSVIQFTGKSK